MWGDCVENGGVCWWKVTPAGVSFVVEDVMKGFKLNDRNEKSWDVPRLTLILWNTMSNIVRMTRVRGNGEGI